MDTIIDPTKSQTTMVTARQTQTIEQINLDNLAHNFKVFKSRLEPSTRTLALVKADGYGTGALEVSRRLVQCGVDYLAVAAVDEGLPLRNALGPRVPIIVLNPNMSDHEAMFNINLEPEVYSIEQARILIHDLQRYRPESFRDMPYPIHVKIDSGMHRLGFTLDQLPDLLDLLAHNQVLRPVSVFTHLSVADDASEDEYTRMQLAYFGQCADLLQSAYPDRHLLRHALNTSGTMRFTSSQMDMVRLGIGLYGIRTVFDGSEDSLLPVASVRSVIISIKEWDAGTTIGYGRRGKLTRHSRVATIPIGYADGYDRHYGCGAAQMWVAGTLCPTVGNVCMDAVMIDITDAPATVTVGDEVEVFGAHVPIETLAQARGTIPYEVLTSVSPRVARVYV